MKVWATSDIHLDYKENYQWFKNLSDFEYKNDTLILAGDISDEISIIRSILKLLNKKFKYVCYVFGNHDLWLSESEFKNSLEKYHELNTICDDEGIIRKKLVTNNLTIIPLQSWYDFSFGLPSKVIIKAWKDFKKCKWEKDFKEVTAFFHLQNELEINNEGKQIISFSHFLPSLDVMPSFLPEIVKKLFPVFGSYALKQQLDQLKPNMHIYGHSHLNRSVKIHDIHYINNAFGYPQEEHICKKQLLCVYDNNQIIHEIPQWPKRPDK